MILETEIAFDDEQAEKHGTTPVMIWRPGVIDLTGVEAFCVCDFNGEAVPDATNLYTRAGMAYTVNVPYEAMSLIMKKITRERPQSWEQIIRAV